MKQHTFRNWCQYYMLSGVRTHHHVTKAKNEDQSRRPSVMDCHLSKKKSVENASTMSEDAVTCIAVKDDRHQNIMSNVAWKNGVKRTVDN